MYRLLMSGRAIALVEVKSMGFVDVAGTLEVI